MAVADVAEHVVDDVAITASSAGLRLQCLACGVQALVLLQDAAFNGHVERFLQRHPSDCS